MIDRAAGKALEALDAGAYRRARAAIDGLMTDPRPSGCKKLAGADDLWRVRVGDWRIVYHRWENQTGDGPYRGSRQICIDRVDYDAAGLIRPIVMTGGTAGTNAVIRR